MPQISDYKGTRPICFLPEIAFVQDLALSRALAAFLHRHGRLDLIVISECAKLKVLANTSVVRAVKGYKPVQKTTDYNSYAEMQHHVQTPRLAQIPKGFIGHAVNLIVLQKRYSALRRTLLEPLLRDVVVFKCLDADALAFSTSHYDLTILTLGKLPLLG